VDEKTHTGAVKRRQGHSRLYGRPLDDNGRIEFEIERGSVPMQDPQHTTPTQLPSPADHSRESNSPGAEPQAPGSAGAGEFPRDRRPGYDRPLWQCVDCGKTYLDRVTILICPDGKRRCGKHARYKARHYKRKTVPFAEVNRREDAARLVGFEECEALVLEFLEREMNAGYRYLDAPSALMGAALAIRLGQHRDGSVGT
jgi:hypothetical protein